MRQQYKIFTIFFTFCISSCANNRFVVKADDPFEPFNRGCYTFNKTVDSLYIKPISKIYEHSIPTALRNLVNNFFQNLNEIPTILNSLLQNKPKQAIASTARFTINSTLGIGGIFDVATKQIPRSQEDFGKTLAVWGYKDSNYLVLPIIGPSTVRDGIGFGFNMFMTAPYYFKPKWRNRYQIASVLNRRSTLANIDNFVATVGVDEYSLVKASYLQNRAYSIYRDNDKSSELVEPPE